MHSDDGDRQPLSAFNASSHAVGSAGGGGCTATAAVTCRRNKTKNSFKGDETAGLSWIELCILFGLTIRGQVSSSHPWDQQQ